MCWTDTPRLMFQGSDFMLSSFLAPESRWAKGFRCSHQGSSSFGLGFNPRNPIMPYRRTARPDLRSSTVFRPVMKKRHRTFEKTRILRSETLGPSVPPCPPPAVVQLHMGRSGLHGIDQLHRLGCHPSPARSGPQRGAWRHLTSIDVILLVFRAPGPGRIEVQHIPQGKQQRPLATRDQWKTNGNATWQPDRHLRITSYQILQHRQHTSHHCIINT